MFNIDRSLAISIRDKVNGKFYRAYVSITWAKRHDNGALISCGLTVPDDLSVSSLKRLQRKGVLTEVSQERWKHSSCLSACILRGAKECRW